MIGFKGRSPLRCTHGVPSAILPASVLVASVAIGFAAKARDASPPLLRFPHASRDNIAFVATGDLWTVPRGGGTATRLTHGPGQVFLPRFSPDGTTIAFTWRRAGFEDVWLVPASGGVPRQLTHGPSSGPYDNMVAGWTPDGHDVLFLSARRSAFPKRDVAAYAVPATGGLARPLPMETSGLLSESGDGHAVAVDRTFRTLGGDRWKRYVGGQAPAIFVADLRSGRQTRITHWIGTNTAPMWWRHRLYFLSDRGASRRLDLWVADPSGRNPRQVTHVAGFDIDVPGLGNNAITFGLGDRGRTDGANPGTDRRRGGIRAGVRRGRRSRPGAGAGRGRRRVRGARPPPRPPRRRVGERPPCRAVERRRPSRRLARWTHGRVRHG